MLDRADQVQFIRDGLARYPDARDTVNYFEKSVVESLFAALDAKTDWTQFTPDRDAEGRLQATKGIGTVDHFISALVTGTLPHRKGGRERVWMALGLYWNPRRRPNAHVVAACSCWVDKGGPVPLLDLPNRNPQVVIGEIDKRGDRRFLIEPSQDFDPSGAFQLLLDSIDAAMGAVASARPIS